MFEIRTDLACELYENGGFDDYREEKESIDGVDAVTVTLGRDDERTGKKAGRYITAGIGRVWETEREAFERAANAAAKLLSRLLPPCPESGGCFLAVGLGNGAITSDAVGPRAVSKMLVTRHIKRSDPDLFLNAGFGCLAAIAPGVLGQTGMESSDLVRGAVKACGAHCVIAVDALASRRLSRLGTTLQLTDTGISPGSGVYNSRHGLDPQTLGVPVVAVGVPTVVDAATLAFDLLEQAGGKYDESVGKLISGAGGRMFVAPKESDVMTEKLSRFIALAVGLAVHRGLTVSEMQEYTV